MDAAKAVRPSKRDVIVIDDEESTSEQPDIKRLAESVSSPEVVKLQQKNQELQQKLDKSEENFKKACVSARTAELRAEAFEERLDIKYDIKDDFNAQKKRADDLENRLAATIRVEEVRRKADDNAQLELALENETLKADMTKLKTDHQLEMDALKKEMDTVREEHEKENEALKTEMSTMREEHKQSCADLESRMAELSMQLEEERRGVSKLALEKEVLEADKTSMGEKHQKEKESLVSEMDEIKKEHNHEKGALIAELISMKEEHKQSSEDWEKRLVGVSKQLEEKTGEASELAQEKESLKTEMADSRREYEQSCGAWESKLTESSMQLEEERRHYFTLALEKEALQKEITRMKKEHQQETESLKTEMNGMGKEQIVVSTQLDEARREVSELKQQIVGFKRNEQELLNRNDELMRRLAEYQAATQSLLQLQRSYFQYPDATPHPADAAAAAADGASSVDVKDFQRIDHPLADSALSEKLLDLVQQALNCNQLKRGTRRAEKTLTLGTSEMLILAADIDHFKIQRDLPVLCEEKNVPYVFVRSVADLTRAAGGERRYAVVSIIRNEGSQLESQIEEIKKDVQRLLPLRD